MHRSVLWLFSLLGLTVELSSACGGDGEPSDVAGSAGPAPTSTSAVPPLPEDGGPAPGPTSLRFVAVGDTGTGTSAQTKIGNTISATCLARRCDFVQLLGDNLYESGAESVDDPIWQSNFEIPYAAIDLEFWAVLGNHDYGRNGLGNDFAKGQNEVDYTTKSRKWKMPSAYWHRVVPGSAVEIFGLDTNMALFGQDGAQRADVASWIAESAAEWKIAVGHHPYKSNGPHGNAGRYDERFGVTVPPFDGKGVQTYLEGTICGKVDLYLAGHDHSRQWLNVSCKGTELAVSGAGAKITELGGKNPALFESLALGFLYIVIEKKTLTAEFVDDNGVVEFTHTMIKP